MNGFDEELSERCAAIRGQGLLRELRRVDSPQGARITIDGQTLLNFASNDYLGLANDPQIKEAAARATERFGAGSGGSRLICGSLSPHHELEETLASFKGTQAAITFSTGYAAAVGTICALLGRSDFVIMDKLVHACIVDAARLCGAKIRVFSHNDPADLEAKLEWVTQQLRARETGGNGPRPRGLIVTESVFSMDGDRAPLREIVALKERFGVWLMVDEAHATGLYGDNGRGLAEELGLSGRIEVQMGTLGKALGASGGFICGSRVLVDYLVNRARSFIFSTAPVPAAAAAATAGIRFVQSPAGRDRRQLLWQRIHSLPCAAQSAIIPLPIGDENRAVETAAALRRQGIYIPAVRYPTVARGEARLRLTITAAHSSLDIAQLLASLTEMNIPLGCPHVKGWGANDGGPGQKSEIRNPKSETNSNG